MALDINKLNLDNIKTRQRKTNTLPVETPPAEAPQKTSGIIKETKDFPMLDNYRVASNKGFNINHWNKMKDLKPSDIGGEFAPEEANEAIENAKIGYFSDPNVRQGAYKFLGELYGTPGKDFDFAEAKKLNREDLLVDKDYEDYASEPAGTNVLHFPGGKTLDARDALVYNKEDGTFGINPEHESLLDTHKNSNAELIRILQKIFNPEKDKFF